VAQHQQLDVFHAQATTATSKRTQQGQPTLIPTAARATLIRRPTLAVPTGVRSAAQHVFRRVDFHRWSATEVPLRT
jgi:hypothetical protein